MSVYDETEGPFDGRRMIMFARDGKLIELPIMSLVVLKTVEYLEEVLDVEAEGDDLAELISNYSGMVAQMLSDDGWFTEDEYLASLAYEESLTLQDEIKDFLT